MLPLPLTSPPKQNHRLTFKRLTSTSVCAHAHTVFAAAPVYVHIYHPCCLHLRVLPACETRGRRIAHGMSIRDISALILLTSLLILHRPLHWSSSRAISRFVRASLVQLTRHHLLSPVSLSPMLAQYQRDGPRLAPSRCWTVPPVECARAAQSAVRHAGWWKISSLRWACTALELCIHITRVHWPHWSPRFRASRSAFAYICMFSVFQMRSDRSFH